MATARWSGMGLELDPHPRPTEWFVDRFDDYRGIGYLTRPGYNQVLFDLAAWRLRPEVVPRAELHRFRVTGEAESLCPKPGEPVRVRWKRSSSGFPIPVRVEPTGRPSARTRFTIRQWFEKLAHVTGYLENFSDGELIEILKEVDSELPQRWLRNKRYEPQELSSLLLALSQTRLALPDWYENHARWIFSDYYPWNRTNAAQYLPKMLELDHTSGHLGQGETFGAAIDQCNLAATQDGVPRRLYELRADAGWLLVIAMTPRERAVLSVCPHLMFALDSIPQCHPRL